MQYQRPVNRTVTHDSRYALPVRQSSHFARFLEDWAAKQEVNRPVPTTIDDLALSTWADDGGSYND